MKEILNDLRVLWIDLWYYISRPFYRLFRGYDERDLWGLDAYIARRILPGLKAFYKAKQHGYNPDFKDLKSWKKAIGEMIYGLEDIIEDDKGFSLFNKQKHERAQKGRELLGKYMKSLWD